MCEASEIELAWTMCLFVVWQSESQRIVFTAMVVTDDDRVRRAAEGFILFWLYLRDEYQVVPSLFVLSN